jgi:hypothetical protein
MTQQKITLFEPIYMFYMYIASIIFFLDAKEMEESKYVIFSKNENFFSKLILRSLRFFAKVLCALVCVLFFARFFMIMIIRVLLIRSTTKLVS